MTDRSEVPAIAGAAQVIQRPGDWTEAAEASGPIELMVQAARDAAEDAGAARLLGRVQWIGVVGGYWSYQNPAQLVAERIGVPGARTCLSSISGSAPQELIGLAAERISRGELDVALVLGGEAFWSRRRLRKSGEQPGWLTDPGVGEPERYGEFPAAMLEEARVLGAPATAYALFDDSLRISRGESVATHRDRIAQLWSAFSTVAGGNPYAWDRAARSAREIREATPQNRMIAFPYTKALVANNTVDLASAILVCSARAAADAGVSADRLVFPHVAAASHDTWRIVERNTLHEIPALAAAGRAAFEHAGIGPGDVEHVELYACFPAIVQMSAEALGFDTARPLTVTGGLGFAGAPVANSTGHGIAAMVPLLRDSGGFGLVHANGGYATKHAVGIYAGHPPVRFGNIDAQDRADLRARVAVGPVLGDEPASGVVEAATVQFDREGPSQVFVAFRTPDGARGLAQSSDADLIAQAMSDGIAGTPVPLR